MNVQTNPFFRASPHFYLSIARSVACVSALGHTEALGPKQEALQGLLASPTFRPKSGTVDYSNDCRPYQIVDIPTKGTFVIMESWARAGIRYLKPDFELELLAPQSFYVNFWPIFRESCSWIAVGSPEEEAFTTMFTSLGGSEPEILRLIDLGCLVLDPKRIRRLLK